MAYLDLKPTQRSTIAYLLRELGATQIEASKRTNLKLSERVMTRMSGDDYIALANVIEAAKTVRVYRETA